MNRIWKVLGITVICVLSCRAAAAARPWESGKLEIHDDHFIRHSDGKPFVYLADTAWRIWTLDQAEVKRYPDSARDAGFTVVQVMAVFQRLPCVPNEGRHNEKEYLMAEIRAVLNIVAAGWSRRALAQPKAPEWVVDLFRLGGTSSLPRAQVTGRASRTPSRMSSTIR